MSKWKVAPGPGGYTIRGGETNLCLPGDSVIGRFSDREISHAISVPT
ncbi:MAG: hypothetical protein NTW27_04190 [Deltaproteobacteria bacterium]|nr:hypothetical protein [Deltaproteobacteria bacterium]